MGELLEVKGLTRRFGGLAAVDDLSFTVSEGSIVGLIGPNGSGKTTTFNVISGSMSPSAGSVRFRGEPISGLPAHEVCRRGLVRTYQVVRPFRDMTVVENVMIAAYLKCRSRQEAEGTAREVVENVGLGRKADSVAGSLTLIELKRLELARVLATSPTLILLDEVAAGLNEAEIQGAMELVMRLREGGMTFVVVEHVLQFIRELSDRILVINFGKLIAEGLPDDVLASQAVRDAYLGEREARA